MATRYYLSLPDPQKARGSDSACSFSAQGADGFAAQLQDALRSDVLFERWRAGQEDPGDLLATASHATTLPGAVLKHRLRLLAGSGWELRDVTAA